MIAPKKAGLVWEEKLKKKVASRLINAMEQSLVAKAGHLELLRSGKDKKIEAAAATAAAVKWKGVATRVGRLQWCAVNPHAAGMLGLTLGLIDIMY